jgi:lysophospholipase L1-like esterase
MWQASWTQAMTDVSETGITFDNVTLRMYLTPGISGEQVRLELTNRYGTTPLVIGRVTIGATTIATNISIPAGESLWTDPATITIGQGMELAVDLYLPEPTPYATANFVGCPMEISVPGDFAGAADFPMDEMPVMPMPDGSAIPLSAPILRGLEVIGHPDNSVVVCIGDSITAGGWPELAAALLPAEPAVAMLNRGIGGNRLTVGSQAYGPSGISRFKEDVLDTAGATHVYIALGTNDLGLATDDELPAAQDLIAAYQLLADRAQQAGIIAVIATITPFLPAENYDEKREQIRSIVNEWIRTAAPHYVDFDAAVRSEKDPTRLAPAYNYDDHLHPNDMGVLMLAQAAAESFLTL